MNNNGKHALWLPENSIRAVLAITLTVATITGVLKQIPMEYITLLSGLTGFALGHYFGERAAEKK